MTDECLSKQESSVLLFSACTSQVLRGNDGMAAEVGTRKCEGRRTERGLSIAHMDVRGGESAMDG
jgi:hypothetical protein